MSNTRTGWVDRTAGGGGGYVSHRKNTVGVKATQHQTNDKHLTLQQSDVDAGLHLP